MKVKKMSDWNALAVKGTLAVSAMRTMTIQNLGEARVFFMCGVGVVP
jgi:hypothetical protein